MGALLLGKNTPLVFARRKALGGPRLWV